MLLNLQQSLIDRVLAHLAARTTDLAPSERKVPVENYFSSKRFELEQRSIFQQRPVVAALSAMLQRPGDFSALDLGGVPVLLSRDRQGKVHAHVNACRHRGTKLVWQAQGSDMHTFTCPYHAWSYSNDGALLGIPHGHCFPNLKKNDYNLIPLPVEERFGLIWVLPHPKADLDLSGFLDHSLSGISEDLKALELEHHIVFKPHERNWRANWKVLADGGLETYHFRVVHQRSIYPFFFDNLLVFDRFSHHQRLVLPKRSIAELAKVERNQWNLRSHANLIYFLFPNIVLLIQPDHIAVVAISPISVSESRITVAMLIPQSNTIEKDVEYWEKNRQITVSALDEDFIVGEKIFEGARSIAFPHFVFGRNELGISAFHESLEKIIMEQEKEPG
jgi:phenylpropionate dioxygenase-like ring-hydroxylating dioxygenase large terminal subunit